MSVMCNIVQTARTPLTTARNLVTTRVKILKTGRPNIVLNTVAFVTVSSIKNTF